MFNAYIYTPNPFPLASPSAITAITATLSIIAIVILSSDDSREAHRRQSPASSLFQARRVLHSGRRTRRMSRARTSSRLYAVSVIV